MSALRHGKRRKEYLFVDQSLRMSDKGTSLRPYPHTLQQNRLIGVAFNLFW